ncbi:MAG: histidinol dehydrogenase, partial [Pseudobacter sp.]|uniref:histidinol dehydrogenase n=1 Tax=Pseudobacter sp. TaxID=2045420 RepID=UPI003F80E5C5
MKIYQYPEPSQYASLLQRPVADAASLEQTVRTVLEDVKKNGDEAVKRYTQQFDKASIDVLQ